MIMGRDAMAWPKVEGVTGVKVVYSILGLATFSK